MDGGGKVYVADTGNHTIRTDVFTLSLASLPPDNDFGIYLAGWLGQQYRVDYKDTLSAATWTMLTTVTLSNGSGQVTDPQSRNLPGRFYRIVLLP